MAIESSAQTIGVRYVARLDIKLISDALPIDGSNRGGSRQHQAGAWPCTLHHQRPGNMATPGASAARRRRGALVLLIAVFIWRHRRVTVMSFEVMPALIVARNEAMQVKLTGLC